MAKKSEIIGEFIVTIHDNDSIEVSRIPKSTIKTLKEIWKAHTGSEAPETWNTQNLGRHILNDLCGGERKATIDEYEIEREDNNRVNVLKTYKNAMDGLREVAKELKFLPDPKQQGWNTQRFGRVLVKFAQTGEMPNGMTNAKMEAYLSYQREDKEEPTSSTAISDNEDEEYILIISNKNGVTIKSQDETEAFMLKEGENKIYLKEHPFLRDGFRLNPMDSDEISDIDLTHVSNLKVKSLEEMFSGVHLERLDLTHLDTSEVQEVFDAFSFSKIGIVDMSGLDLSKIDNPKWCGMFRQNYGIGTIILNGCNAKTIKNIKEALRKDSDTTVIADSGASTSEYEDITVEDLAGEKHSGNIVIVMTRCDAKTHEELYEKVHDGDIAAVVSRIDDKFHYICDHDTELEDIEEQEINFDELYIIYDNVYESMELSPRYPENGIYLPESSYSYLSGEEYPDSDNDPCFVMAEALTGDETGHVWPGVYFYPTKTFICDWKIISKVD